MTRCLLRADTDATDRYALESNGRWWSELSENSQRVATEIYRNEQRNFLKAFRFYYYVERVEVPFSYIAAWWATKRKRWRLDMKKKGKL